MKKLLLVLALVLSVTILSGCGPDVYIEPNTISVIYENPHYVGSDFYIDVYITNGYDTDEFVGYMEFDIYTDDDEVYIAGAGFDIDETIQADGYIWIELEFGSEFVFASLEDINDAGYDLDNIDDIILYFWLEE